MNGQKITTLEGLEQIKSIINHLEEVGLHKSAVNLHKELLTQYGDIVEKIPVRGLLSYDCTKETIIRLRKEAKRARKKAAAEDAERKAREAAEEEKRREAERRRHAEELAAREREKEERARRQAEEEAKRRALYAYREFLFEFRILKKIVTSRIPKLLWKK